MTETAPTPDDFELEQTANGEYCCPVDSCDGTSRSQRGVAVHYGTLREKGYDDHDSKLVFEIVSEDEWKAFLRDRVYNHQETNLKDIAAILPDHIGRTIVQESMSMYGISDVLPTSKTTQILADNDVTSIQEAREHAKKINQAKGD